MKFISFNVNGIGQEVKRKMIFNNLKKINGITLIQESHSEKCKENLWKSEWKSKMYFSHGLTNSRGICTIIPNHIDHILEEKISDNDGRILIIKIKLKNQSLVICNVYAPIQKEKDKQLQFIKKIKDMLTPFQHENIIIGGDFNFYMNPKLDKSDKITSKNDNITYRNEIKSLLESMALSDPWRLANPELKRFTWHSRSKSSRLDYFFTSDQLLNEISNYKINPGLSSDHSILIFELNNDNIERGRGFWKFNSKLLHNPEYVKNIKEIIKNCKSELEKYTDKGLTWEIVKLKIRSYTIPFCIKRKKEKQAFKLELENKLAVLQEELDTNPNQNTETNFKISKEELENIEKEEINGLIFRSKLKWYEDGEKNSKFFLNLEKKNYQNKLISQLEINNTLNNSQEAIAEELTAFYKTLYTEKLNKHEKTYKESCKIFSNIKNNPIISETQKQYCDNKINEQEILSNLKKLHNGKTPGSDGLPSDFYKFFWTDIKTFLIDSIHYAMNNNELSIEQKRGIITLIPKKEQN
jgi:exonuclease III